ncbi:MAG: hypothetical protein HUJ79_07155 [Firmicutes bacterium]|nr:hypothetical protein [Bacillota bacterium]
MNEIEKMGIDLLMETDLGPEIQKTLEVFEKVQETAYNLVENQNDESRTAIKVGTALVYSMVKKICDGRMPQKFTSDDWKEIALNTADIGINLDEREYTKCVFKTYARYIELSTQIVIGIDPGNDVETKERAEKILQLSEEIRYKTEQLNNDEITEVTYIEDCLWISLEGMLKLLSAYMGAKSKIPDVAKLIEGLTAFSFEYGRLMLFRQEQQLLTEYLENQKILDEELQKKYEAFLKDLQEQSDAFDALIKDAFESDFRSRIMNSAKLAEAAGVEEGILYTIEDTDDFFLN